MPDCSQYDVPAKLIAMNRAEYYANKVKDSKSERNCRLIEEYEFTMSDEYELQDWAANNMCWEDVKDKAIKITDNKEIDFQEGWVNGEKEIIEKEE